MDLVSHPAHAEKLYIYKHIYIFSSLSIVIDEGHVINFKIEEGICECVDG